MVHRNKFTPSARAHSIRVWPWRFCAALPSTFLPPRKPFASTPRPATSSTRSVPLYALGSTVDRVPSNATDAFFSPAPDQTNPLRRMGRHQLSPEHRPVCAGLALESERQVERSRRQRLLHWRCQLPPRNDPPLVRLLACSTADSPATTAPKIDGYSRLDDGDPNTYWKSNPYLTNTLHRRRRFPAPAVGGNRPGSKAKRQRDPHRLGRTLRHASTRCSIGSATATPWTSKTRANGKPSPPEPSPTAKEAARPYTSTPRQSATRYVRILMTQSSNTCDTHGSSDRRNCVGYAISELYLGAIDDQDKFKDLLHHSAGSEANRSRTVPLSIPGTALRSLSSLRTAWNQEISRASISSLPAASPADLPAIIPIAMLYGTPKMPPRRCLS